MVNEQTANERLKPRLYGDILRNSRDRCEIHYMLGVYLTTKQFKVAFYSNILRNSKDISEVM